MSRSLPPTRSSIQQTFNHQRLLLRYLNAHYSHCKLWMGCLSHRLVWRTSQIKSSKCSLSLEGSRLLCVKSFLTVYRQYLLFLDSHPEEYLKYLAWKGHYEVGLNQPISIVICVFRWNADRLGPATCVRGFTRSKTGSWEDLRSSKISQRFSSFYYSCRYSCRWCW